jgi:hypothetical protein
MDVRISFIALIFAHWGNFTSFLSFTALACSVLKDTFLTSTICFSIPSYEIFLSLTTFWCFVLYTYAFGHCFNIGFTFCYLSCGVLPILGLSRHNAGEFLYAASAHKKSSLL